MSFKSVCLAGFAVTLLFGLCFAVAPAATAAQYGIVQWSEGQLFIARLFGSALLFVSVATFALRDLADPAIQRSFAAGFALVNLLSAALSVHAVTSGATNPLTWSTVAIYAFFAVAWGLQARSAGR
jgi:hypothetical protein